MEAFKCDWCGKYKCGCPTVLKIYTSEFMAHFDLCDKCQKELLEKLRETKSEY